jgi:hypothetical protein
VTQRVEEYEALSLSWSIAKKKKKDGRKITWLGWF